MISEIMKTNNLKVNNKGEPNLIPWMLQFAFCKLYNWMQNC